MRRTRTGLAGLLMTMVVCTGLVIGGSSPASALQAPIDIGTVTKTNVPKTRIGVAGASIFGRTLNRAGWVITLGQLAFGLYENRDTLFNFDRGADTPKTLPEWHKRMGTGIGEYPSEDCLRVGQIVYPDGKTTVGEKVCGKLSFSGNVLKFQITEIPSRAYVVKRADGTEDPYVDSMVGSVKFFSITNAADNNQGLNEVARAFCKNDSTGNIRVQTNLGALTPNQPARGSGGTNGSWGADWTKTLSICSPGETLIGARIPGVKDSVSSSLEQSFGLGVGYQPPNSLPTGNLTFKSLTVQVKCKNFKTGEVATVTARTLQDGTGQAVMPSCTRFGADWRGVGLKVAPTMPEIDNQPIAPEIPVPDFAPLEWDEEIPKEMEQPCTKTKEGCALGIWIDNNPCDYDTAACRKWDEIQDEQPSRVRCKWGRINVDMKYCLALKDLYKTKPDTKPELDPDTKGDPATNPGTGTSTGPGTSPSTGGQTGTGQQPTGPVGDPEGEVERTKCLPSGWGLFNPIEWIYKPVRCALRWAFEPQTSLSTRATRIKDAYRDKAPFKWLASISAMPTAVSGGGCPSWNFTYKGRSYDLLCGTQVGSALAGFRPVWLALGLGAAAYPFIRGLVYAATPIVKPTPS